MRVGRGFLIGIALLFAVSCGGRMPEDLGVTDGRFRPCPDSPNCVSSFATDERHGIPAIEIEGGSAAAWAALGSELENRPRVEIVENDPRYVHAVFTTKLMRYRDDVEFYLNEADARIEVRSASRVGYGDMDANRNRIESIRAALAERGVARPASDD